MMNPLLREHVKNALQKGVRMDGRKLDEFRPISIKVGTIATAEGSAHVRCGDTEMLAGVKMNVGTPFGDTPDKGVLMVGAELLPLSNPKYESGPPSIDSIEIARVIDRGIRESKTINEESLCIASGEMVWMVNVDLVPLNSDGNMIDVGAMGAIAALLSTHYPGREGKKVDYKVKTKERLKIESIPVPITVIKIGDHLLVDPTDSEYDAADCRLTVTTLENGDLCAMQKGGDEPITLDNLQKMLDLATKAGAHVRKIIQDAVKH